jgi:Mg2+-importing ATPase
MDLAGNTRRPGGRPAVSSAARNRAAERKLAEVCQASEQEALGLMESRTDGLTADEVEGRLASFGENHLAVAKRHHVLKDLFGRAKDPLVIQLLVICLVSALMGDARAAVMVGAMIFLSVILAYVQERRSSLAVEKLQKLVQTTTRVQREAKAFEVPIAQVVPGDIVLLAAGDIIPADVRVLAAKDFYVSQSALTGESMPVEKSWPSPTPASRAPTSSAARPSPWSSPPGWRPTSAPFRPAWPPLRRQRASTRASSRSSA